MAKVPPIDPGTDLVPYRPKRRILGETIADVRRGARTIGRGIRDIGAGFVEGLVEKPPRPSPRRVGRALGEGVGRIGLRGEEYFWGDWEAEPEERPRRPVSRLPFETQRMMVRYLAELYPEIYMSLWYEGISYSEFIGSLRNNFPDIYEELREYVQYPRVHYEY